MSKNPIGTVHEFATLTEALQSRGLGSKGITYIEGTQQEHRMPYHQLLSKALGILKVFQDKGLKESDELIIFTHNNELFVDAFWACLLGGIVPVPVSVGISDEHRAKLFRIFNQLEQPNLYTDDKNLSNNMVISVA